MKKRRQTTATSHTIASALATLDRLEAEAGKSENRTRKAVELLEDKRFHGSEDVRDFATLRAALIKGTPATTAPFKTALETIARTSAGVRLRRSDEPARIVDLSAYIAGVPECYYHQRQQTKPIYKIAIFNTYPHFTPAGHIANRAAAIVALAKQLKAQGASVQLQIIFNKVHDHKGAKRVSIPFNLDALNIGQLAFIISPAFYRTYSMILDEEIFSQWDETTFASCQIRGDYNKPTSDSDTINLLDYYQQKGQPSGAETADKYGTPERAFATVKAEFEAEIKRISQTK